MREQWRSIPGVENYLASNLGRIKSVSREVNSGPPPGVRILPETILKPFIAKNTGYMQVMIGRKKYSVHRLIASAWCSGYFDGAWVDHKNSDRTDNHPRNLEWVTPSENSRRSFANGRDKPWQGKFSSDHSTSKSVVSKCLTTGDEKIWPSAMDAVRAGFDSSSISRCCSGRYRSHKGHQWKYAETVPVDRRMVAT